MDLENEKPTKTVKIRASVREKETNKRKKKFYLVALSPPLSLLLIIKYFFFSSTKSVLSATIYTGPLQVPAELFPPHIMWDWSSPTCQSAGATSFPPSLVPL